MNAPNPVTEQRRSEDYWKRWRQKIRLQSALTDGSGAVDVAAAAADAMRNVGTYPSPVKGTSDCADGDGAEAAVERRWGKLKAAGRYVVVVVAAVAGNEPVVACWTCRRTRCTTTMERDWSCSSSASSRKRHRATKPKLTSENYWLAVVAWPVAALHNSSRTATWFGPSRNDTANCWLALLALPSRYRGVDRTKKKDTHRSLGRETQSEKHGV